MRNLTIAIFLLVATVAGCKMFGSKTESNPGNSSNSTSADSDPTNASTDPKADLIRAANKFNELPMFKAAMDLKSSRDMHTELEYVAPDRFRIKTGTSMEMIVIGKTTYMNAGGKWRKVEMNTAASISKMRDAFNEEGLKKLDKVDFVGEDTANGKEALVYSYKGKLPTDGKEFTSKIWISKSAGLPIKIVVDYSDNELKRMTTNYDTDSKVTIEPPVS